MKTLALSVLAATLVATPAFASTIWQCAVQGEVVSLDYDASPRMITLTGVTAVPFGTPSSVEVCTFDADALSFSFEDESFVVPELLAPGAHLTVRYERADDDQTGASTESWRLTSLDAPAPHCALSATYVSNPPGNRGAPATFVFTDATPAEGASCPELPSGEFTVETRSPTFVGEMTAGESILLRRYALEDGAVYWERVVITE